jgi:two-component system nitrate/nitrite response regulator NarL
VTGLVIGDDHSVFLDAMSAVLEQRGYQVTAARSVQETIDTVCRIQPDVCLIDRNFAGQDGITAISPMLAASSGTKVLVLSADPDTDGIRRALHAGASGYLHKTRGVSALTRAIERVQRGEVVVDVPKPAPARPGRQDHPHRLAAFLTTRERECLLLLVEGLDTAGIATKLGVSAATIRTHVQSLMTKLGVHSRLEAASYAVRFGLLDDEESHFRSTGTGLARGSPLDRAGQAVGGGGARAQGGDRPQQGWGIPRRTPGPAATRPPRERCPVSPRLRLVTRLGRPAGDPAPCPGEFCYLIHRSVRARAREPRPSSRS